MSMEVDATTLTLISGLLVIIVMLMGLMLQILRRLDGNSEMTHALAAQIDSRTAELNAEILINRERIQANGQKIDNNSTQIRHNRELIDGNRELIRRNRELIDGNRTRIDSLASGLRSLATGFGEFRIETRENFDQIRTRLSGEW